MRDPERPVASDRPPAGPVPRGPAEDPETPTGPAPRGPLPHGSPPPSAGPHPAGPSPTGHPSESLPAVEPDTDELADVVTDDLGELEKLTAERDEYLDALRRTQADFENYRKRMLRQQTENVERAAEALVVKLLPVLDNFDLALAHGAGDLEPVYRSLVAVLESEGLERLDPVGKPFDPNEHEAVSHEDGDGGEPEVLEVMRAGYRWKGRVLRPAMVKVRG